MRTLRSLLRPKRASVESGGLPAKPCCADALRACEEAAAQMKSASDQLAACWSALRGEISAGATGTELLRTRAWCNVLELRLKEHAHALEQARHGVDAVWREVLRNSCKRKAPGLDKTETTPAFNAEAHWGVFAEVIAGANAAAPHAAK